MQPRIEVILGIVMTLVAACASERPDATSREGTKEGQPPPAYCGTPNDGCPCESPGTEVDCGQVKNQSGDHVSCSMGKRVCLAGKWGPCHGTHLVTKSVPVRLGNVLHTNALTQGACPPPPSPLANACDPYCQQILDDGLITIPGGAGGGACAFYETADASASYSALNGGWQAIRAGNAAIAGACSTGTSDPCGHNAWCPTGVGCQFFASGQTNPNCSGANWDLTFGTPCLGSTPTMTICNRGNGPTPGAGTYWGVVQATSLQGKPTDVSLCKAAPANVRGYCSLNFATTPIGPGNCVSVATSTLCPGVNFGSSGAGGGDRTTIQWNMPDWPDPNCGNKPRVSGECIDKNNFTVLEESALLACQGVGCGGGGGAGGGGAAVTLATTANGTSSCNPGPNIVTSPCNAGNQYTNCQQDHRCDLATGTCVWNGGEGWFDPSVPGVDLTVGAACETGGAESIPVCNRGSGTIAAGTPINLHFPGPAIQPDSCIVPGGAPSCTASAPAAGLAPGKCMNVPCAIPGNKYAIVSGPAEAPGVCSNNQAYVKTSGAPGCAACTLCSTRVSGKVFDPSSGLPAIATASNLPLSGITVFQPSAALIPLVDGLACDSCSSTDTPSVLGVRAVTDAAGAFTLTNVTPGPATRIVVQSGRWRREITLPVTACVDNAQGAGTFRLPRDRFDGNGGVAAMPKTAIIFGNNDPLQCLLRKVGISAAEMQPRSGPGDLNRFQIYRHPNDGGQNTVPAAPSSLALHGPPALLNEYSQLISGCTSGGTGLDAHSDAQVDAIITWAQQGGRAFMTHGPARDVVRDNPTALGALFKSTGTWDGTAKGPKVKVVTGTGPNDTFRDWLVNVGASITYGAGFTEADPKTPFPIDPGTKATAWLRGPNAGNGTFMYSFETPVNAVDCGTPAGLGRVFYSGQHTSGRDNGSTFPTNCDLATPLTPAEKALAFHYFGLGACVLGGAPPPPPPPPLVTTYVTRDYEGKCGVGEFPEWQFLYWQAITPPGTTIDFRAATASTMAALPASPPAAAPTTVAAGTASGASIVNPTWKSDPNTIAWHLANEPAPPGQPSREWLRIYVKMNPIGSVPPTVTGLRVDYSCKPAE